jgi:hypothetical protein
LCTAVYDADQINLSTQKLMIITNSSVLDKSKHLISQDKANTSFVICRQYSHQPAGAAYLRQLPVLQLDINTNSNAVLTSASMGDVF